MSDFDDLMAPAAIGGGILALVLGRNPALLSKALNPVVKGVKAGAKATVAPAFKRTVQNTLIPISYEGKGITTGLKTMAKHPIATAQSVVTNTHLASHPKVGKQYLWNWMNAVMPNHGRVKSALKQYGGDMPPPDSKFWRFWENEIGLRNVLMAKGMGTKTSKGLESFEDVFRFNKGGVSFNRQNAIGMQKYDELIDAATIKLNNQNRAGYGTHSTLGQWTLKDMEIGGKTKAIYEDIWDVGLNAPAILNRQAARSHAFSEVKGLIKNPVSYIKNDQLPTLKNSIKTLVEGEQVWAPRSLLDAFMKPVTVRGTLPNRFIQNPRNNYLDNVGY